ncbi:hypothetical protein PtA15_6A901 [Puccinia triticina]|uniref:Uncharacterized protein n=1 Tax=Puccinia triticina TaxID=208348 RepID=A0ABY7CM77_9BASI|nr:uncharacterized protein PtA15_6A901 [Puccinia triticina]WAQ86269.1 hypothetical protein PtA15_6A901 [Puccinia triticina]WAR56151.1 hypothetical protein PtB15_6B896 [Puccinia triticina]
MSNSTQPSILCPLPRRTHSNPIYNTTKPSIPPRNNQKKLGQELASSDDVFVPQPSIQTMNKSTLTHPNHTHTNTACPNFSRSSPLPRNRIGNRSSSTTTISIPQSNPRISPTTPPTAQPNHPQPTDHPEHSQPQFGLAVAPNHLSSIVSSPISRCHNPLPRHAELDALACRLAKPFKSFALDQDHLPSNGEDEERAMEQTQSDHPLSALMPALTLEHSVSSLNDP